MNERAYDMQKILSFLTDYKTVYVSKRPWAHFSKKGSGRKHQQGKRV